VIGRFAGAAGVHPDRPAILHNGNTITYRELSGRVGEIAAGLGRPAGTVAVPARHHPDTVAALLAIWAAGGAYCPVDPTFPAQRQRSMLAAAGCRRVLRPHDAGEPAPVRPVDVGPDEPAYCLFTSGSTGTPKPVITPHRAIATVVGSLRRLFELDADDRVLQFASLNWDTAFEEMLPTLTTGAALVMHDEAFTGSFPRFLRMVEAQRVTVLDLPTAFWHELVTFLAEERATLPRPVRLLIIGGEAASPARLAQWSTLDVRSVRLLNTYGCTETTLITHAVDLAGPPGPARAERAQRFTAGGPVPIGRALPHVVEHIGDDDELLIGGPALASGYLNLPEQTEARFVTLGGVRYFRTGDRVTRRPDGVLVHRGRLDQQLKIRGIRVDPAEVEAHLSVHPAVRAVAVIGRTVADHLRLVAYVVARPRAGDALAAELTEYLRARVPAHLVPNRIRLVSDLVYTATGKVDRKRLSEVHA